MKAVLRTFESGAGDCIFLILSDELKGSSYHIMVDCNVLTDEIKSFICKELKKRIDTLIVTHIDSDHVNGITRMMRSDEFKDVQIGQILFNGFQPQGARLQILDKNLKSRLEAASTMLPPTVDDAFHKTNGMDAACLVTELNKHPRWKAVWRKEPIHVGTTVHLGEPWGILRFLSPSQDMMKTLLHEVKLEYARILGEAPPDDGFEDQDKYFELMLRLSMFRQKPKRPRKTSGVIISEDSLKQLAGQDADEAYVTNANKASLAFVWEGGKNKKRVLFMGDAVSSTVVGSLDAISKDELLMEAVKVSHHGSKFNSSLSLINKINSVHYFITGGKQDEGPHLETITKIALKSLPKGETERTIHFNHWSNIQLWDNLLKEDAQQLLGNHHLKLTKENVHTFEY